MGITELESIRKHGARPAGETIAQDIFASFGRGSSIIPETIANLGEIAKDLFRKNWRWPEKFRSYAQEMQRFYQPSPSLQQATFTQAPLRKTVAGLFGSLPYTTVAAIPEVAGATAGAELAGILGSMGLVGLQAAGEQYHEARQYGLTPAQAMTRAIPRGIGEAALEFAPAERLMRTLIGRGGGILRNLWEQALTEGVTEAGQQLWQNILSRTYNPNQPLGAGVLESGVVGGVSGGLMGGLASIPIGAPRVAPTMQEASEIEMPEVLRRYQEAREKVRPITEETVETPTPVEETPREVVIEPPAPTLGQLLALPAPRTKMLQQIYNEVAPTLQEKIVGPARSIQERPVSGEPIPLPYGIEAFWKVPPTKVAQYVLPKEQLEKLLNQPLRTIDEEYERPPLDVVPPEIRIDKERKIRTETPQVSELKIKSKPKLRKVRPPLYERATPRYVREVTLPSGEKVLLEIVGEYQAEKGKTPQVSEEEMGLGRIREGYRQEVKRKYYRVPKITGKQTNWSYHFNVYTKDGLLIDHGYATKSEIRRRLLELSKHPNLNELAKQVEEELKQEVKTPEPENPIALMLKGEISTLDAIDALTQQGYTPEQAEATVNAAWEKYSQTLPEIQADTAREFVSQAVAKGLPYEEAIKRFVERKSLEIGISPEEYANKIISEALLQPNTRLQVKYIKENLNPNITTEDWKEMRKDLLYQRAIEDKRITKETSLEEIKEILSSAEGYFTKKEIDEIARKVYEVKESTIPYDDAVALTENLVEDLLNRNLIRDALNSALKRLQSEEGYVRIYDDQLKQSILDNLKLFTTAATVLEHSGPDPAELVQVQRDIYHNLSIVTSHLHRLTDAYKRAEKRLSRRARNKLAQWFKQFYDRTHTSREALKKEYEKFLRANPSINKKAAWELFNSITGLNDLLNYIIDPIEQMYYADKVTDVKIVTTDAYQLSNGKVVTGAKYRWMLKQGKVKSGKPVVVAEIEIVTQQGIRRQTVVTEKEGDWFARLREYAKQRALWELRPWENYIPHYRSVKDGMYWAMVIDETRPDGEQTVFAKTFKNKRKAYLEARRWALQHGLNPNSETVGIIVKQHVSNPENIPVDILPIEVEGWLAKMGIDPDSDEAQRIINEIKTKSGFYSHFLKSKDIEGWEDTLDGFLRGYIQAINTSMFTYQRLKSKNDMYPILRRIEESPDYSAVVKKLARAFMEAYTKFEPIGGFEKWLLRTRAFVYAYALANKLTYVTQNALEWIYALPATTEEFIKAGDNEAKAFVKTLAVFQRTIGPASPEVKRLMKRAEREGLTAYKTWLKYELHPETADVFIEAITNLDVLGQQSEHFSSEVVFRIGLETGRLMGLHGEKLYQFARDFLLGKGKIFMTKGNKIGLYLLVRNPIARVIYPLFVTVIADILGKFAFRLKWISPTVLFLMLYQLVAGIEGLPFVDKKQFSELTPLGRFLRKGLFGLAGLDSGFLALRPYVRAKAYLDQGPAKFAYGLSQMAKEFASITSAVAFFDIVRRASLFADKYNLSVPEMLFLMMPAGGVQHLYRNAIEATFGARAYNKYRKIYKPIGWRADSLAEWLVSVLGFQTARKFDAWERYKKAAEARHKMWAIEHPFEYLRQRR